MSQPNELASIGRAPLRRQAASTGGSLRLLVVLAFVIVAVSVLIADASLSPDQRWQIFEQASLYP